MQFPRIANFDIFQIAIFICRAFLNTLSAFTNETFETWAEEEVYLSFLPPTEAPLCCAPRLSRRRWSFHSRLQHLGEFINFSTYKLRLNLILSTVAFKDSSPPTGLLIRVKLGVSESLFFSGTETKSSYNLSSVSVISFA